MARLVRAVALVAPLALAGCMVGPDFHRPDAPTTSGYTEGPLPETTAAAPVTGGASQRFINGADVPAQWWTLFRSEALDALVRRGIEHSPTLEAATATLRQAQETYRAEQGALLWPSADLNASATREKITGASIGQPDAGSSVFSLYNASVNVAYRIDVAGGFRRQLESLQAQIDYQRYQLDAAYLTLTANIVTAAMREASLRAEIKATIDIIQAYDRQIDIAQKQYDVGGIARADLIGQRTQAANTRATLPALERDLAKTRHQLAILVGDTPGESALPTFDLESLTLPMELPVSLPSELARQRPDIRLSEALLHQASAQVGVATANLYPQINLTGTFGLAATRPENFFGGPALWSLGAGLAQPLFHGGELEAQRRAAIAAYDAANAQYRETVLLAFGNVADALRSLEHDARTLEAQADATALARETLDLVRRRLQLGAVRYIDLLEAQRVYQNAALALAQAQGTRFADTAALFQALGGGWWNAPSAASALPLSN